MSCPFSQKTTVFSARSHFTAPGTFTVSTSDSASEPWPGVPFIVSIPNPESNACGLRIGAHVPCYFVLNGKEPDWDSCVLKAWLEEHLSQRGGDTDAYAQQP